MICQLLGVGINRERPGKKSKGLANCTGVEKPKYEVRLSTCPARLVSLGRGPIPRTDSIVKQAEGRARAVPGIRCARPDV